ncbi:MAG: flagellar hook-basal body complex protein FliE [Campylobacterota bacterium]|nr:flagellar hook-basal body complex protein FliE [Campylobacterota bacterium]
MNIGSIGSIDALQKAIAQDQSAQSTTPQNSFANVLSEAMGELNETQVQGYKAMQGIATGEVKNLQEAVQKIEEAELSLKLALEVKNKAIGAYKEVMRMQV